MLHQRRISCPYCGEAFDTTIDASDTDHARGAGQYTEDCQICCRPIVFAIESDDQGELLQVNVRREDD